MDDHIIIIDVGNMNFNGQVWGYVEWIHSMLPMLNSGLILLENIVIIFI
jgi:hypothetical protein